MAFFRCGGGGLPSGLQSDMDAVLNKKFGTSTTYPPTGWPDDVNLMGPLPEKTASGAIASFSDGADDVPVKSAKFYFLPQQAAGTPSPSSPLAITGWTGLTGYHNGKNLLDMTVYDGGVYNPAVGTTINLTLSSSQFTKTGNAYTIDTTTLWKTFAVRIPVKSGVIYSIKFTMAASGTHCGFSEYYIDADNKVISSAYNNNINPSTRNGTITPPSSAKFRVIVFTNRDTATNTLTITEPQIEVGSTATTYEAYSTPTTYPVSWSEHGTIYGGYVDATRGKVVKTHESVNFNDQSLTWTYQNDYGRFLCQNLASYIVHASSNSTPLQGLYSESYQRDVAASSSAVNESISCSTLGYLFVYDSGYSDVNTWLGVVGNRKIIYPLQTPVEYDITAFIPSTYLGSNNFYSDANGDTEITYRADISLLLNSLQNNMGLMMMSIPEEQEETEEPEPESDER